MEKKITTRDKIILSLEEKEAKVSSNELVIITHGICEYKERYQDICSFLNDLGLMTITYDLRGHGKSGGKRGNVNSYMDFIEDLQEIVQTYKVLFPKSKVYLLGHSMGGLIVNLYATKYYDVDKIFSIGAPGILVKDVKPLKFLPLILVGWMKKKNNFNSKLTSDKAYNLSQKNDPNALKYMRFKLLKETLVFGVRDLQKNLLNIKTPMYYMHGKEDKIVDYKASLYLHKNNPNKYKEIVLYENLGHEILNEPNSKGLVYKQLETWIKG